MAAERGRNRSGVNGEQLAGPGPSPLVKMLSGMAVTRSRGRRGSAAWKGASHRHLEHTGPLVVDHDVGEGAAHIHAGPVHAHSLDRPVSLAPPPKRRKRRSNVLPIEPDRSG